MKTAALKGKHSESVEWLELATLVMKTTASAGAMATVLFIKPTAETILLFLETLQVGDIFYLANWELKHSLSMLRRPKERAETLSKNMPDPTRDTQRRGPSFLAMTATNACQVPMQRTTLT